MKLLTRMIVILLGGIVLTSCISNRRIVYLQDKSQHKPWNKTIDTTFAVQKSNYILEPQDILYLKSEHVELTEGATSQVSESDLNDSRVIQAVPILTGYSINDSGNVNLPVLGRIHLSGLSLLQAQDKITNVAREFYTDPSIKIFLLNNYVTILGEVNKPGRYPIYDNRINVFQALGEAGGATDFADREEVKIIRSRDNKQEIKYIDLTDENLLTSPYYYLQPGDILMVKPQKRKKYATRDVQNVFNAISAAVAIVTLYLLINKK